MTTDFVYMFVLFLIEPFYDGEGVTSKRAVSCSVYGL